jgi:hypothetical protein
MSHNLSPQSQTFQFHHVAQTQTMAPPTPSHSEAASPPPRHTQSGREQTVSYADLMKPDEDWRNLPNAADRRKIQNRLAQRAYRE